ARAHGAMDSSPLDSNDRGVVRSALAGVTQSFSPFCSRPGVDRGWLGWGGNLRQRDRRHLFMLARDGPVLANWYRPGRKNAADFQRTISHRSPPDLRALDSPRSRDAGDDANAGNACDRHRAHRLPAIRGAPRGNLSPRKTWQCLCDLYETGRAIFAARFFVRD